MKKIFSLILVLVLAFALCACGTKEEEETTVDPETEVVDDPEPVVEAGEAPLLLNFKNKTGVTITGLYLYEAGATEKGNSLCIPEWPDKDADGDLYEFYAYVIRNSGATFELYVEFADGTNATWKDLTLANYDKLSLKDGVDPAAWEHEACDDQEDIDAMDALKAAGATTDHYYGEDYAVIGVELKNKTGQNVTGFYFYEEGGDYSKYNNMVGNITYEDGSTVTLWGSGKASEGGLYVYGFFVRPIADSYSVHVEFEDGHTYEVTECDFFTPDADGNYINEISLKDAEDPDLAKIQYDDDVEGCIDVIAAAIEAGKTLDGWYPTF